MTMSHTYDYLIVGSGLFGATFAHLARQHGKRCLVIDKRPHLGGNVYCEEVEGIHVHKYGAHIFHTSNKKVWDFVNSIVPFNRYTNSPVANYQGRLYNLPFNMNTFYQMWGVKTPAEAQAKIDEQRREALESLSPALPSPSPALPRGEGEENAEVGKAPLREGFGEARNLEEQALSLVGKDIYERLIKGYTEKQWGRKCTYLPAFIIKRLPIRLVYDNNYFNDKYQGIPIGGYNKLIEGLLSPSPALSPSPSLPRGEGGENAEVGKAPLREGFGEAIDVLTGIDVPLCAPTRCLNHENGGYREMADPMNYGLLKENAKEMRKNPTEAESAFWSIVSGSNLGVKFRRQHIIGNYIVDFVCLEKKLIVEIDGGYHDDPEQQIADNLRSKELKEYGFTILRLRNEEVLGAPDALKNKLELAMWLSERAPIGEALQAPPQPSPVGREKEPQESLKLQEAPLREGLGRLVYTGAIDEYFGYKLGKLDWRTVRFETEVKDMPNYQGNAVVNYTDAAVPYTRVIEHKHFEMFGQEVYDCPKTVVSKEYSTEYKDGMEPYYPVNNERNNALAQQYRQLAHEHGIVFADECPSLTLPSPSPSLPSREGGENAEVGKAPLREEFGEANSLPTGEGRGGALFGGRLAEYRYYDMAPIIEKVLGMWE